MLSDCVSAPLYDTLSLEQIIYCLNLVGASAIYCSIDYLPNILASVDKIPTLKTIISFDKIDNETIKTQTKKVLLQLEENGVLIDDGASMYSFTSISEKKETPTSGSEKEIS